ncbi:BspA family leucine-rich repeat surface protein, partial [Helicobacter trogontum]|uniref:BspA family leucine-rich repeat surface protein n=1 Tax=Helicobacter trogontum TaxID=50960 RepID=UPI002A90B1DD
GISTFTHIYANTFKYHPKNKQELLKLIRDNNVYLGDIDTSKITDMSGLFWVVSKDKCKAIAKWKEKTSDERIRAKHERNYQLCLEVSVQEAELEEIRRKDFSGIEKWNVSNVTDMAWMFSGAVSFNQSLNSWNVSKVISMDFMFANATSFSQPLDSWNVSKVTDMMGMFAGAESFNQSLNSWNVGNVKDMSYMFAYTTSFNQPLDSWDVSNVEDMSFIFNFSRMQKNPPKWYKGN